METEEAIKKAKDFLTREAGYATARLVSVKFENGIWNIKFDVGIFTTEIVKVEIDESGKLISFEKLDKA